MLVDGKGIILMLGSVQEARAAATDAIASSWQVSREINEVDLQGGYVLPVGELRTYNVGKLQQSSEPSQV